MGDYIERIENLGACFDAVEWLRKEAHPDLGAAWAACPRADWLLWLTARCATDDGHARRAIVSAAVGAAEDVFDLVPADNNRLHTAVETARRWTRRETTIDEVRAATDTAVGAIYIVSYYARSFGITGYTAAWAAWRAANTALPDCLFEAADIALAAAENASKAASAAGRKMNSADIVRRHIPHPPNLA